jgi:hypothetical protein
MSIMLQVISGMYFRAGVPLYETRHRRVLFTNANFLNADRIDLPFGYLTPGTNIRSPHSLMVHFTEKVEAVNEAGADEFMMSTGGDAILEDIAVVLSFALNACFTTSPQVAHRLIQEPSGSAHEPVAADFLPETYSSLRTVVDPAEIEDLYAFIDRLLSLNRSAYESALLTMRRVVTANSRVAEDPTLAYTDYVAALERLSSDFAAPAITWERLDHRKRAILSPALDSLEPADQNRIRTAIMDAERVGIKHRYVEFILAHTRESFFREEAADKRRPVWRPALRRVVGRSYDARSKSLHELQQLAMGTWLLVGGAETATPPTGPIMLTHAGLSRLTRHVVRTYVDTASTEIDTEYRYREHLPNIIRVILAPTMYIGLPGAIQPATAAARASQFITHMIEMVTERETSGVDMRTGLAEIEALLRTHRQPAVRQPLLAIYLLWHLLTPPEMHRPSPAELLQAAERELQGPTWYAFAAAVLMDATPPWSATECLSLAEARYEELQTNKPLELPERLDAGLWILVAQHHNLNGEHERARDAIGKALDCCPGQPQLLNLWTTPLLSTVLTDFDIRPFVLGTDPEQTQQPAQDEASQPDQEPQQDQGTQSALSPLPVREETSATPVEESATPEPAGQE